jgi:drug/metabolite transporter (DMT)-like permease
VPAAYIVVILIWSTTPLAIKWSSVGSGFLFGVSARMVLGTMVALMILALLRKPLHWHKQARRTYLAASMGIYGSMMCVYWGAQFIPSGLISVIFGLTPLLIAMLAGPLLGERSFTPVRMGGILLAIGGLWQIFHADLELGNRAALGIGAIVVGVSLHAVSTVLVKRVNSHLSTLSMNAGSLLMSALLFLLTWIISGNEVPAAIPDKAGIAIVYLGIVGSVLGFSLYFYALKQLDASVMGLIPLVTPVIALMLGQTFNGEHITPEIWIGTGFILTGLVINQWGDRLLARQKPAR